VAAGRTWGEYEIRKYRREPKTMLAPPELLAIDPLGGGEYDYAR
jgi:hypothetical protein